MKSNKAFKNVLVGLSLFLSLFLFACGQQGSSMGSNADAGGVRAVDAVDTATTEEAVIPTEVKAAEQCSDTKGAAHCGKRPKGDGFRVGVTSVSISGSVTTISLNQPGVNYAQGQQFGIVGGDNTATVTALTVSPKGAVTSIELTSSGSGYAHRIYKTVALVQRFNDLTGIVTDSVTGLSWQQADDGIQRIFNDAKLYCASLKIGTETGFRMPTESELKAIWNPMQPGATSIDAAFTARPDYYWTGTEFMMNGTGMGAYAINFSSTWDASNFPNNYYGYGNFKLVRCVK